ncbi:uncharacterized protein LOC121422128 [Lytechinus variegatus]|uniref:uncharacterized protein LOC121422128 n=1 Tax=Lytechinus variegatus TaxID=7654 RepID=UPI001BB28B81|nr:uncharacterized protein LOC121422128 [Lytechinus variegatus]XP_041472903.1 uncharacterized protein LOC121422128 [Lytechinus variegatus]
MAEKMEQFLQSCERQATKQRVLQMEAKKQDSEGPIEAVGQGAVRPAETHQDLEDDTCPLRTSTPKKNSNPNQPEALNMRSPSPVPCVKDTLPALPINCQEVVEEVAELCPQEEEDADGNDQTEVRSMAGDLQEVDTTNPVGTSKPFASHTPEEIMSSVDWVTDASIANTEEIKKLEDTQRKHRVAAVYQHSKSMTEIELLKNESRCHVENNVMLSRRITALENDKAVASAGVEPWKISFLDLKRNKKEFISSRIIQTKCGGCFQAKLFLNGVIHLGKLRLRLVVYDISEGAAAESARSKYRCRVQLLHFHNITNSVQEEQDLRMDACGTEFLTLFPMTKLEENDSPFVKDGVILINLIFEKI